MTTRSRPAKEMFTWSELFALTACGVAAAALIMGDPRYMAGAFMFMVFAWGLK